MGRQQPFLLFRRAYPGAKIQKIIQITKLITKKMIKEEILKWKKAGYAVNKLPTGRHAIVVPEHKLKQYREIITAEYRQEMQKQLSQGKLPVSWIARALWGRLKVQLGIRPKGQKVSKQAL
jgi:hypothetical protein